MKKLIASSVVFDLSNLFTIKIAIPTTINVTTYAIIDTCMFPLNIFSPAIVDEITDGSLANVDIKTNRYGFIGKSPAMYTNKSFGVPGIKNNINIIHSIFLGF